jgi:hypothetical protein
MAHLSPTSQAARIRTKTTTLVDFWTVAASLLNLLIFIQVIQSSQANKVVLYQYRSVLKKWCLNTKESIGSEVFLYHWSCCLATFFGGPIDRTVELGRAVVLIDFGICLWTPT